MLLLVANYNMNDFEKLNILSKGDAKNKTAHVKASYTMVRADKVKQGGTVTMGIDEATLMEIVNDEKFVVMYIIDKNEFKKL